MKIIRLHGSRSKKRYSTFNMAARREGEDLPARCLSLLEEVKDLIEAQRDESNGTQSELQASSSSLVPQVRQRDQRVMQNFQSLFAPYNSAGASSARPPTAKKSRVAFQVKETWTHELFFLGSTTDFQMGNSSCFFGMLDFRLPGIPVNLVPAT